ncbi:hypothetical protein [Anaerostipes faecalis]|uniref:hypothetical protein n=1 Tax=Anaerostipes faecalis TaxID=2738446 RepID=UPI003F075161
MRIILSPAKKMNQVDDSLVKCYTKASGRMEQNGSKVKSCILACTCEYKKGAGTRTAARRKAWN